jgi:hypothetical protein
MTLCFDCRAYRAMLQQIVFTVGADGGRAGTGYHADILA